MVAVINTFFEKVPSKDSKHIFLEKVKFIQHTLTNYNINNRSSKNVKQINSAYASFI